MIGISTVWQSKNIEDGKKLLKTLASLSFSALELDFRISETAFKEIKKQLKKDWTVLSIHNYFPRPDIIPLSKASGDLFLLSHLDKEERILAIKATIKTMEIASDLEAQAIVIHAGKVEMENEFSQWKELFLSGQLSEDFVKEKKKEREKKAGKYLDAVLLSIDKLLSRAEKLGVKLGIENRLHFHEIPSYEEMDIILKTFEGAPIGFWYDVGHAEILSRLMICPHEKWLSSYDKYLIGVHIHDVNEKLEDHFAPGQGTVNFEKIIPYLNNAPLKIFEIHSKSSAEDIEKGLDYLKQKGLRC